MKRFIVLTDAPNWVAPLCKGLRAADLPVEIIDLKELSWVASEPFGPAESLFLNRLSARPGGDTSYHLSLARDLLASLEATGHEVINGARCHGIGTSKLQQAALFAHLGLPTPWTASISAGHAASGHLPKAGFVTKPNPGGRGEGIHEGTRDGAHDETFQADGCGVLQAWVDAADGCVHRVELLDGRPLYEASFPLRRAYYNYCLGGADAGIGVRESVPLAIAADCKRVARAARMELGSVEYLVNAAGEAIYIDINPVSTLLPVHLHAFSRDPLAQQVAYLRDRFREAGAG